MAHLFLCGVVWCVCLCGGGWLTLSVCVVRCVQAYLTALRLRKGTDVLELFHFYDPQKGRQTEMWTLRKGDRTYIRGPSTHLSPLYNMIPYRP